ncbi:MULTISPECIES: RNA recognition motif domain-containing protein [Shewanella]|uniref:RNA-binding protein n=2 Tax=Unclassified Bacteria TaxID=49928 RepID=A0AAU6VQA1_UNCXX|nr:MULTISPECIES: RNA-binding protein [Shewanella]MCT8982358.1 RNA-binding protein [Shewanella algae]MDE0567092.1 RNA-binding protein [Shewanella sp. K8]
MQKSFLIVLGIAILGALAIYQLMPQLPAFLAFPAGALLAAAVYAFTSSPSQVQAKTQEAYNGPTMTLYVGNLPYRAHDTEVKSLFEEYGPVNSVRLVRDRKTGRRKGFGFVEMSESGAQKAMTKLNDFIFQERTLKVREAKSQDSDKQE